MTGYDPSRTPPIFSVRNQDKITTGNRQIMLHYQRKERMGKVVCGNVGRDTDADLATPETQDTEMKESGIQIIRLPIPIVVVVIILVLDRSRRRDGIRFHYNPQSTYAALQITVIVQQRGCCSRSLGYWILGLCRR